MAEHDVSLEIPKAIEVGKCDLKIRVLSDGIRFGTLTISKGAIETRTRKVGKITTHPARLE